MESTGMGLDTSVFLPLESVYRLAEYVPQLSELSDPANYISAVAVKVESGLSPKEVINGIMKAQAIEWDLDFVLPDAIVTETARELTGWSSTVNRLALFVWLAALLALALVFSVSIGERRRELGVYRLLGATRGWLCRLILSEAVLVSLAGAMAGLIGAALIIFPFDALIFQSLGLPNLPAKVPSIAWAAAKALVLSLAIAPLSCLRTVLVMTRSDVQVALRDE
jgi:putative ABC transport system permease protein